MNNAEKQQKASFNLICWMDFDSWLYNLKLQEAEHAFHLVRLKSIFRFITASLRWGERKSVSGLREITGNKPCRELYVPVNSITAVTGKTGQLRALPIVKKSLKSIWVKQYIKCDSGELPPVKLQQYEGLWVLSDDAESRVLLELARYRGMHELEVSLRLQERSCLSSGNSSPLHECVPFPVNAILPAGDESHDDGEDLVMQQQVQTEVCAEQHY